MWFLVVVWLRIVVVITFLMVSFPPNFLSQFLLPWPHSISEKKGLFEVECSVVQVWSGSKSMPTECESQWRATNISEMIFVSNLRTLSGGVALSKTGLGCQQRSILGLCILACTDHPYNYVVNLGIINTVDKSSSCRSMILVRTCWWHWFETISANMSVIIIPFWIFLIRRF